MISKCANPSCSAAFRYYHEGKLFPLQRAAALVTQHGHGYPPAGLQYMWLCDVCCQVMTVAPDGSLIPPAPQSIH